MAATQSDLFLAVLALDAYNRGSDPGMTLPPDAPTMQTGGATILDTFTDPDTSFYAIAYQWHGETIISYRGTRFDGVLGPNLLGDVLNGWTRSAGFAQASQAQEALAFYAEVKAETDGPIVLTGHSLGGGLAGFVSDLTGASADVFNDIPFGTGVAAQIYSNSGSNLYGSLPTSSSTVQQFITFGEVATGLRAASPALSLATLLASGMDPVTAAAIVAAGTARTSFVA